MANRNVRRVMYPSLLSLCLLACAWNGVTSEAQETLHEVTGTMQKVGSFGYGIVPDNDDGSRYAPTEEVPESFRVDGLRVLFSGVVSSPDDGRGGRRWGTPIELTQLEHLPTSDDEVALEADGDPQSGDP